MALRSLYKATTGPPKQIKLHSLVFKGSTASSWLNSHQNQFIQLPIILNPTISLIYTIQSHSNLKTKKWIFVIIRVLWEIL